MLFETILLTVLFKKQQIQNNIEDLLNSISLENNIINQKHRRITTSK